MLEYRIETWTTTGELVYDWAREPGWMPPQAVQINMTRDAQQHPMVVDPYVDAEGRLWTMIRVNAPEWHRGLGTAFTTATGEDVVEITDINQVFGTRIEVLDVAARRVLASIYTPDLFVNFLPNGRAVSYEEMPVPRLVVWQLALRAHRWARLADREGAPRLQAQPPRLAHPASSALSMLAEVGLDHQADPLPPDA